MRKVSKILETSKKKIRFARKKEIRELGFEPGLVPVTIIEKLSGGFVDKEIWNWSLSYGLLEHHLRGGNLIQGSY